MAINFTTFGAALEKVILPSINAQMYERAPMWQLVGGWSAEEQVAKRANVHVSRFENNNMYMPIRSAYHSGITSVGLSEKYNYGQPTINETFSSIKTLVGSFTIPKQLLNTTSAGSIVKPLMFYSQTLGYDLAMDANRQVYGGADAIVATVGSSGTGTTVNITASTNGDIDYSRYLPVGCPILIGSQATTVASVTGDNSITIADSLTITAGDAIRKATGDATTTANKVLDGLKDMIAASGSYQNLTTASDNSWKSYVDSASETVYIDTIQGKMHNAFFKANKVGKVNWIVMNSKAFQTYGRSLTDLVRFQQKEVLSGGWIGLDYMAGNAQIVLDYDCPDDKIFFLSADDLVFGQFQPLEFEKGTDGTLLKIGQKLDYEVTASWMGNIGTTVRGAHSLLSSKTFSLTKSV